MKVEQICCLGALLLSSANAFIMPVPLSTSSQQQCLSKVQSRRSSALSMNLFDRFARVTKSNLNNILQKLEDPEKMLNQAVEDMQADLVKVRQSYAEITATNKRLEKQRDQAQKLADEWYGRAQLAIEKGNEELAREALTKRQQQVDTADSLSQQLEMQSQTMQRLFSSMQELENEIYNAKAKKDEMIARARTAKTTQKVNDMLSDVGTGSKALDAFRRMEEKVDSLEAQAEVSSQMRGTLGSSSMEAEFKALESSSSVDAELQKLKGALPGGPVDDELEKLKKDMGK